MKTRSWCSRDVGDWRRSRLGDGDWFVAFEVIVVDLMLDEFKLFKLLLFKLSMERLVVVIKKFSFSCALLRLIPFSLNNLINQSTEKCKTRARAQFFVWYSKNGQKFQKMLRLVIKLQDVVVWLAIHQKLFVVVVYVHKFI